MSDINRVVLVGRLTRDPETKATTNGKVFTRISLASNRYIYNKDTGEGKDEAGFFECVAFGRAAETIGKHLRKGSKIGVDGSLRWSSWENKDGKKASKVEIMIDSFQFMDSKPSTESPMPDDEDIPY